MVLNLNNTVGIPQEPGKEAVTFNLFPFQYDAKGETLRSGKVSAITVLDDQEPLIVSNDYNGNVSHADRITAVSYTHLDVYKRQVTDRQVIRISVLMLLPIS